MKKAKRTRKDKRRKGMPLPPSQRTILRRTHRVSFLFNDEELKAFNRYVRKYHVSNRSRFIRESVMTTVLKQMAEDHPTLF